jgi:fermentation-respiration switch protein FrsA (DUF1100 family)
MAISDDLFLAILAMDSYNRGYNSGLGNPETGLDGGQVGGATILDQIDLPQGSRSAGFYAIVYEWNGTTVISYRGTDSFPVDRPTGYGIGLGFPAGVAGAANWLNNSYQGELALLFYNQIAARLDTNDILLTGHSLGGGLATLH